MNIVVTGANGFIGKNLVAFLANYTEHQVLSYQRQDSLTSLKRSLSQADIVFHLAGVNRPPSESEFISGNVELTKQICDLLLEFQRPAPLIFSSSVQAKLDNPYGISKRQAEQIVQDYARQSGASVTIYQLKNVFGKWCQPNYNSVVATFCHNIAHDLPITISDPNRELELVYVDDVIAVLIAELQVQNVGARYGEVLPTYHTSLGKLAELIHSFRQIRQTLQIPDLADEFTHKLYSTYVSYLEQDDFGYSLNQKCDARGCLAEFVKAPSFGQVFVSRTHPGITRGNHYHHLKTEKFLVLEGEAIIRFRHIRSTEVLEYHIRGEDFRVVDIPPGYTHSIENVGNTELVTLFWASEQFNPNKPDTFAMKVK